MSRTAPYDLLAVIGPTASGKTSLAVRLASLLEGEVISAYSRQVYRGLDIGSGKDLDEYTADGRGIRYHCIDIAELDTEFSVFDYQQAFYTALGEIRARGRLPVLAGGTGLYIEAALAKERMAAVPENPALRADLAALDTDALAARLAAAKPRLHNTTDLEDRERLVRAIEIAEYTRAHPPEPAPALRPMLLGTRWDRQVLRQRIARRLKERLAMGMIEEVRRLHEAGHSWERLELLGLEYRFVAQFLQGIIKNENDLFQKLNAAIAQFAKRQDTWFRRMERQGHVIHWVDEARLDLALAVLREPA